MTKQEIRLEIKKLCAENTGELAQKSTAICNQILNSEAYKNACEIYAYMALPDEVDLSSVIFDALQNGKKTAVPKIISLKDSLIQFFFLDKTKNLTDQTSAGTYGISEPDESLPATPDQTKKTLILVPGRAFTKEGDRLGRGKGFYDRFLGDVLYRGADIVLAGVCFDFQIKKSLPVSDRDIKMDILFTSQE